MILASILHGLLVADSLDIPSNWIDQFGIGNAAQLNYSDYALSIGRILGDPIPLDQIDVALVKLPVPALGDLPYRHSIESIKGGLL